MDLCVFNKHPAPIERMPWKEDEGEVEGGEEREEEEEEGKMVC